MKKLLIICLCFCSFTLLGQEISREQMGDFSRRAKKQIAVFLTNLPTIAGGGASMRVKKAGIKTTLRIFSPDAFIEEQSKYSQKKKEWKPESYFNKLLERAGKTPILIDFDIVDDLSPDKIKRKVNKDGTISYTGKMVFRQYYCKLKQHKYLKEPNAENPNINCSYSDTTDKEVKFEFVLKDLPSGRFWVTKITYIKVQKVI